MELLPEEERLIKALRKIKEVNPLGIDGYTASSVIEFALGYAAITAAEAERRYKLFLEESKRQQFVDIKEALRKKDNYEDLRASMEHKANYERDYLRYGLPAPIWLKEAKPQNHKPKSSK